MGLHKECLSLAYSVCVYVSSTYTMVSFTDINHVYLQNTFVDSIKYSFLSYKSDIVDFPLRMLLNP